MIYNYLLYYKMKRNFKDKKNKDYKKKKNDIRICTYNILAPMAVPKDSKHYSSCDKKCMKWENRFKMIKDEILNIDPEIICLVEVQTDLAYIDIMPTFNKYGYHGFYIPQKAYWYNKESKKNIPDPRLEDNNFGVAILFKTKRFDPINFSTIDYHKLAKKFLISSKLTKFKTRVMKKFAAIQLQLKDKVTKKEFFVCCVHLEHNPLFSDVKNLQAYLLMKVLSKISNSNELPVVLCGDFNSHPKTAVYHGITTGESSNKFDDEKDLEYKLPFIKTPEKFNYSPYKSCFNDIFKKEPNFTNYTVGFKDTLDYIFVNKNFKINSALEGIDTKYEKKYKSFPNVEFPSDHVMLSSDIQIK